MTPRSPAAVLRAILDSTEGIHIALREEAEEALFTVALEVVAAPTSHVCQDGHTYPFSRAGCGVCGTGAEDPP